ncbi:hypothetical protein, partial [Escherichia coli]|uniref:hypothetical protein n=1 Tax=Escherichia coli TaxID=562 RepID=UPI001FFFCC44
PSIVNTEVSIVTVIFSNNVSVTIDNSHKKLSQEISLPKERGTRKLPGRVSTSNALSVIVPNPSPNRRRCKSGDPD